MSMLSSDCGFRCWHPKWLNRFATARWFTLVYGFLGTLHTASVIYFAVTLSTIQKRFKIPSQTTGEIWISIYFALLAAAFATVAKICWQCFTCVSGKTIRALRSDILKSLIKYQFCASTFTNIPSALQV